MNRTEAVAQIGEIRESLTLEDDREDVNLASIIRGLLSGYPLDDVRAAAKRLLIGDFSAERHIKAIVVRVRDQRPHDDLEVIVREVP